MLKEGPCRVSSPGELKDFRNSENETLSLSTQDVGSQSVMDQKLPRVGWSGDAGGEREAVERILGQITQGRRLEPFPGTVRRPWTVF